MRLSQEAIDEFKKIYLEEYKVTLSDHEACKKGLELLKFVKLIYEPVKTEREK